MSDTFNLPIAENSTCKQCSMAECYICRSTNLCKISLGLFYIGPRANNLHCLLVGSFSYNAVQVITETIVLVYNLGSLIGSALFRVDTCGINKKTQALSRCNQLPIVNNTYVYLYTTVAAGLLWQVTHHRVKCLRR